jgi:hypothetical protein
MSCKNSNRTILVFLCIGACRGLELEVVVDDFGLSVCIITTSPSTLKVEAFMLNTLPINIIHINIRIHFNSLRFNCLSILSELIFLFAKVGVPVNNIKYFEKKFFRGVTFQKQITILLINIYLFLVRDFTLKM